MLTTVDIQAFLKERIDPDAQREGQDLVQSEKVTVNKLTSQVVGGIVEGTSVQIQFTPEKVIIQKECSCTTRKCRHIPALLQVISESQKSTFSNKAGFWRKSVEEMEVEGMKSFILEQVKRNKATAYDLRSYILRQQGVYAVAKAKEILDELKSPVVRSTKVPSAPQIRLFGQVTKTMISSCKDLVQQGYTFQGLAILMHLSESLHYVFFRLKRNNSSIMNHIQSVESLIADWLVMVRAPESQYDIVEKWMSLASKSYFVPLQSEHILLFFEVLPSDDLKDSVFRQIESLIQERNDQVHGIWVEIWLKILLHHPQMKPAISLSAIQDHKHDMLWRTITRYPLGQNVEGLFNDLMEDLSPRQKDPTLKYLLDQKEVNLIIALLQRNPELQLPETSESLANEIYQVAKNDNNITSEQLGSILAQTKNTKEIHRSITTRNFLPVTLPLLKSIPQTEIGTLEDTLVDQVNEYLNNHIGNHSKNNLEELIQTLEEKQNYRLIKRLKKELKSNFGHRKDIIHVLSTT